ncbi:uncharacterized protein LOC143228776 [Tachypleus tridentatus]|uniref:uncharacterized protein LOC143228776 n=1 Tax=Tachypleus tridentatus TaxID=6853 RepID=UPI003FD1161A
MDNLVRALGSGVHSYRPFQHRYLESENLYKPQNLQKLCKVAIVKISSLRKLKYHKDQIHLPAFLVQYLSSFTTDDFEEIECAPFTDLFNLNFYHRALTYRVRCRLDGQEYLAAYGTAFQQLNETYDEERQRWIKIFHKHLMCVYAEITDESTGNNFFLLDVPQATLEHVHALMFSCGLTIPEGQLWELSYQLSSILLHILSCGLHYGPFGLDNIFMVGNIVVLENELTRKSRIESGRGSIFRQGNTSARQITTKGTKKKNSNFKNSLTHSNRESLETKAIWYFGQVLCKLATTSFGNSAFLYPLDLPQTRYVFLQRCMSGELRNIYSSELKQLIISTQFPNRVPKLTLEAIHNRSYSMLKRLSPKSLLVSECHLLDWFMKENGRTPSPDPKTEK